MRVGGILWGDGQPAGLAVAKTSLFIQKVFDCKWYKRGPERPAGPQGPAGPDYVAPYQQGYIRGIIIAQDTFNNRRVRESYNYVYYNQSACDVYTIGSTLMLSIERWGDPTLSFSRVAGISLGIDTTGGTPTVVFSFAGITHLKQVGSNIVTGYSQLYEPYDPLDTLIVESLTFSPQFTQVQGRLRGIRRNVTPPDTVTFEFESIIPRTYQ
jgi:hypothetical protein